MLGLLLYSCNTTTPEGVDSSTFSKCGHCMWLQTKSSTHTIQSSILMRHIQKKQRVSPERPWGLDQISRLPIVAQTGCMVLHEVSVSLPLIDGSGLDYELARMLPLGMASWKQTQWWQNKHMGQLGLRWERGLFNCMVSGSIPACSCPNVSVLKQDSAPN